MGNNVAGNLVSRLNLLRRIANSAADSGVKEGAPTLPEEAIELLVNVEAAQNAAATGELSGLTAAGGAAPEVAFAGVSVASVYLSIFVGLAVILGAGVYIGYKFTLPDSSTPADGKPGIVSANQAERQGELSESIKAAQDIIKDPSDVDPATLRAAEKFLQSLPTQSDGTQARQDNRPEFSVHGSDRTVTNAGVAPGRAYDFSGVWLQNIRALSNSWYCTRRYKFERLTENRYGATFLADVDGNCRDNDGKPQFPQPFDFEFEDGRFRVGEAGGLLTTPSPTHWQFDGEKIYYRSLFPDGSLSDFEDTFTREK